jgi:hypothetical protein
VELELLQRQVRQLRALVMMLLGVGTLVLIAATTGAWSKQNFDEITVHRINVVDREGTPAMVLAGHDDAAIPVILGVPVKRRQGNNADNGIIFFNQKGDEQGGLIWSATDDRTSSGDTLSFDTAQTDQLVQVDDGSDSGKHYAYLVGWDRLPNDEELALQYDDDIKAAKSDAERQAIETKYTALGLPAKRRFFVGYGTNGDSQVALSDKTGATRIKLFVTRDGRARLQFLDAQGNVTYELPPQR